MLAYINEALKQSNEALSLLRKNDDTLERIDEAAQDIVRCYESGGCVYSCGNGGSMCDAMHFAEEMSGRFRKDRRGLPATAISDPGHISCVANDFGYDYIFSRYIECHGKQGDILLAISTSGTSKNVVKAAEIAKDLGMNVVSLTGKPNSKIGTLADIDICTPGGQFADRTQELHIKVIHILIELVERSLFPDNYGL